MQAANETPSASHTATQARWHEFLRMAVNVASASGGAVWTIDAQQQPQLLTQFQLGEKRLDELHHAWPGHVDGLTSVASTATAKSLEAAFEQPGRVQKLRLFLVPIVVEEQVRFVLELFLPREQDVLLSHVEQLVQQLLSWASPGTASSSDQQSWQFATWLGQIHQDLSLEKTGYAIVNETQVWSRWERVTLLIRHRRAYHCQAVSGVETIDPRASTVHVLEQAARSLSPLSAPLVSTQDNPHEQLAPYHERTRSIATAVFPLVSPVGKGQRETIGLLFCDQFVSAQTPRTIEELDIAVGHISRALDHALQYEAARAGVFAKALRGLQSRPFLRLVTTLVLFTGVIVFLAKFPAELIVTGTGTLEPALRREIFAASTGLIESVHVVPDQHVQVDETLVVLRSPELEFEINRVEGELQTVEQQISDLDKLRSDPRRAASQAQSADELVARREELKSVKTSLQNQLALLQTQRQELTLLSPISGTVISSTIQERLVRNRPVSRTDRLLSVADLEGDWLAILHVDHRDLGPVFAAQQAQQMSVSLVTPDAPETPRMAQLKRIAPIVESRSIHGPTLQLDAHIDRDSIPETRPGTTVQFRINCGSAPIGYVWFRRFIDQVRAWWTLRSLGD